MLLPIRPSLGHGKVHASASRHPPPRQDQSEPPRPRASGGWRAAAAARRLLARLNGLSLSCPALREAARLTGADVPVCLEPRARMMRGAGEALGPALDLPRLFAVLVNPRVPVETPAVFREL